MPDLPKRFGAARTPTQRLGGSAGVRDTSRTYRALRAALIAAEPLCRYCRARGHITAAQTLDHILALSLGGSDDPFNLAPACKACNDEKAGDEMRFIRRGYDLADARHDPALVEWFRLAQTDR